MLARICRRVPVLVESSSLTKTIFKSFCFSSYRTVLSPVVRLSLIPRQFCTNYGTLESKSKKVSAMSEQDIVTEELLKIFILDKEDEDTFTANHLGDGTWLTRNVYGGCLFAQSLVAAQKTIGPQFLPHSMHSLFILNVSPLKPVIYKIQRLRDGRSFATRFVTAHQEDKIVYSVQISFHVKEESAISHQYTMPNVEPPERFKCQWDLAKEYLDKAENGELEVHPHIAMTMHARLEDKKTSLIESRPVNPDEVFCVVPHKSFTHLYWMKVRTPLSDDRDQHRALAAYITDATLAGTGSRAHVSQGYTPSMVVSLDNNCWFHTDDFRVDEWMLYENESPVANNGRAFSLGRLWTRDGRLILSAAQESLHRTKVAKSSL